MEQSPSVPNRAASRSEPPAPGSDRIALAQYRTRLALDRTTLAWIRTTLTMATFGFGMVAFFRTLREKAATPGAVRQHEGAIQFGIALVVIGTVSTVLAGVSHWKDLGRLRRNEPLGTSRWSLSITVAMLLAVLALFGLWATVPR